MEALYLQLVELYEEFLNKFIENVATLTHELGGLFLGHQAWLVNLWRLKVGKQQYENFVCIPGDLNKIDMSTASIVIDLMEVPVEYLSRLNYAFFIVPYNHGWRSLSSN